MNSQSRIPALKEVTFDGALYWFSELQTRGLLFHPEDAPETIVASSGTALFTKSEAAEVRFVVSTLESTVGSAIVIEAAYPIFMKAFGNQLNA